ncbi:MAG TPA: M36 family metallopeptidase, partial [Actinomycetota bacterium]|nr:M36 family metallopeptidase [Actinomycetota bacterium]
PNLISMIKRVLPAVLAMALAMSTLISPAISSSASPGKQSASFVGTHVIRGDLGAGSPSLASAKRLLANFDQDLGVEAFAFRFEDVRHSIAGVHFRGSQYRGGVPVEGTSVAVHFVNGRAKQIEAHGLDLSGQPTPTPISKAQAIAAALNGLGVVEQLVQSHPERLLTRSGNQLVDVWRVPVLAATPAINATVDVAALDGSILGTSDESLYLDGSATLFNPSPIVTLKDSSIRQPGEEEGADTDLDSEELTKARVKLPLKDLDEEALASGRLSGPWVNVYSGGNNSTDGKFTYTRSDPRFEAGMAYAHLDAIQRYFRSLGFKGKKSVNAEPQDIIATPVPGFDNSFYQPGNDVMLLGSGGVDDGEDAEVIAHEYGHAVQDAQVPGWGNDPDGGAMGEGFGDFQAGAYYARNISKGFQDACVADWDATSYSDDNPPCLRRLDGDKHYPEDLDPDREVHNDGEIWSAFLWDLRKSLGRGSVKRSDRSITLVLASHEFLTPDATFGDAVAALRTAAKALHHRKWAKKVNRAANKRGLPLNPK